MGEEQPPDTSAASGPQDLSRDARLVEVEKIWDDAPHNAFTDLVRFKGKWYCAFREGSRHAGEGDHGVLRVLVSEDGAVWQSAAKLSVEGADLRDAKLSVTPDERLMINTIRRYIPDQPGKINMSLSFLSEDGLNWDGPHEIGDRDYWLWRTTWFEDTGYNLGYSLERPYRVRLYETRDGRRFRQLVDRPFEGVDANEHAFAFSPDGTVFCLLRRDASEAGNPEKGLLGVSRPPYAAWTWKDIGVRIGGPAMIRLPDGRLLAAVRRYPTDSRDRYTELGWIDSITGKYMPLLELPSGGDTSYAGMVFHEGMLWISYYSSHEDKTSIYLAQIQLDP